MFFITTNFWAKPSATIKNQRHSNSSTKMDSLPCFKEVYSSRSTTIRPPLHDVFDNFQRTVAIGNRKEGAITSIARHHSTSITIQGDDLTKQELSGIRLRSTFESLLEDGKHSPRNDGQFRFFPRRRTTCTSNSLALPGIAAMSSLARDNASCEK